MANPSPPLNLGIFGAALDTGNRGVEALAISTISGIAETAPNARITSFDYGKGIRSATLPGADFRFQRAGWYYSRRFYRTTNLAQMLAASRFGLAAVHPTLRIMRNFDAILDISGGDSFSDIYGARRLLEISASKHLAIQLGVPLILLPQTYGPYISASAKATAKEILTKATWVWSRDQHSQSVAQQLLGPNFDPARHQSTYDVAFRLPVVEPTNQQEKDKVNRVRERSPLLLGLNVSGLTFNEEGAAQANFGMRSSYRELIVELVNRLLAIENSELLLVPHVIDESGGTDCDASATAALMEMIPEPHKARVTAVTSNLNASELKWVIGQTDWFCGTRMHACIGALSQEVPTTAIAYSDKTLGVFTSVGMEDSVVDPREADKSEVIEQILHLLSQRHATRDHLSQRIPSVKAELKSMYARLVEQITTTANNH